MKIVNVINIEENFKMIHASAMQKLVALFFNSKLFEL